MDYKITFTFHLVERSKPKELPRSLSYDLLVRAENSDGLRKITEEYYSKFVKMQGVFIEKNPLRIISSTFEPDSSFFVPAHMISHVETHTQALKLGIPDESSLLKRVH